MTEKKTEQEFIDDVKSGFERSVDQLDADTVSRLDFIRHKTLTRKKTKIRRWLYYPAGALITACLVIIILNISWTGSPDALVKADDFEMLSSTGGFDLYDNLEFYQWLEDYETSG